MRIVHWRFAGHYNSAARKTVCGEYLDDVDTTHHHQGVTCLRCQRSPEWQQAVINDRAAFVRERF
jgi:hypothetical protein